MSRIEELNSKLILIFNKLINLQKKPTSGICNPSTDSSRTHHWSVGIQISALKVIATSTPGKGSRPALTIYLDLIITAVPYNTNHFSFVICVCESERLYCDQC